MYKSYPAHMHGRLLKLGHERMVTNQLIVCMSEQFGLIFAINIVHLTSIKSTSINSDKFRPRYR